MLNFQRFVVAKYAIMLAMSLHLAEQIITGPLTYHRDT
jgi:hypothetical protein